MAHIKFSTNWNNKLACMAFTTIRLFNPEKYKIGETYEIFLTSNKKDAFIGLAEIVEIRHFKLENLNNFMAMIDTGYSADDCTDIIVKMYKNSVKDWSKQYFSFILLKKINIKNTSHSAKSEKQGVE